VTTADAPLCGTGRAVKATDLPGNKSETFSLSA
jgi:hypothetical protein